MGFKTQVVHLRVVPISSLIRYVGTTRLSRRLLTQTISMDGLLPARRTGAFQKVLRRKRYLGMSAPLSVLRLIQHLTGPCWAAILRQQTLILFFRRMCLLRTCARAIMSGSLV